MSISEAFSKYCKEEIYLKGGSDKTIRNYRSACVSLINSVSDIPISLLTLNHLTNWQLDRTRTGHSTSTIAHDISRLKQVLRLLKKQGMSVLDNDLIDRPKVIQKPPVYLVPEEVRRILDQTTSSRDKALFAMMFDSGARVSELLGIDRTDISNNSAQIIGKGSKVGTLYFSEWSMSLLEQYLDSRKDGLTPLFISSQNRRITVQRVEQLLHLYTGMAGIDKNVTPHVLRHSFATDLKRNGADIFDIKEQLRHKRISSTEIYVHIEETEKIQKYKRFHTVME